VTTVVLMVRHGSHDRLGRILCGRMAGVCLSEEGLQEAETVGRRLAAQQLAAVYSSPLERARQTAEPIAARQGLEVEVEPDLNEIDFGAWTGKPFDELHADPRWPVWNSARGTASPPGGESMAQCQARLVRLLDRLQAQHADQHVALVSHSDVIKAAIAHVLGLPLDHYDRFEISPASISTVVLGDWGAKVHTLNEAAA
jgi:probable phosphomutase (TIGR03848 family)